MKIAIIVAAAFALLTPFATAQKIDDALYAKFYIANVDADLAYFHDWQKTHGMRLSETKVITAMVEERADTARDSLKRYQSHELTRDQADKARIELSDITRRFK